MVIRADPDPVLAAFRAGLPVEVYETSLTVEERGGAKVSGRRVRIYPDGRIEWLPFES